MKTRIFFLSIFLGLIVLPGFSQLHFDKSEYQARREKLMDKIPDGLVIIRGSSQPNGFSRYYQFTNIMYFAGLEIPDLILVIDGVKRSSTLFFTMSDEFCVCR